MIHIHFQYIHSHPLRHFSFIRPQRIHFYAAFLICLINPVFPFCVFYIHFIFNSFSWKNLVYSVPESPCRWFCVTGIYTSTRLYTNSNLFPKPIMNCKNQRLTSCNCQQLHLNPPFLSVDKRAVP